MFMSLTKVSPFSIKSEAFVRESENTAEATQSSLKDETKQSFSLVFLEYEKSLKHGNLLTLSVPLPAEVNSDSIYEAISGFAKNEHPPESTIISPSFSRLMPIPISEPR